MRGNKIMGFLWIIIAVCLAAILFLKLNNKNNNNDLIKIEGAIESSKLYTTYTYAKEDIHEIDIDVAAKSVTLEKSTDNKVYVELYCSESSVPKVELYKNTLKIEEDGPKVKFIFKNSRIIIKLPEGIDLSEVDINTASGSLHLNNINCPKVDLKSASGSIHLNNCNFDVLDSKSSSGSVNIDNCTIDNLECKTLSGSIRINGNFDQVEAQAVSGSIHAILNRELIQKSELQTTSGSIHLKVPASSSLNIDYSITSGTYRNRFTGNSGKNGIDNMNGGAVPLHIRTVSGSVSVE